MSFNLTLLLGGMLEASSAPACLWYLVEVKIVEESGATLLRHRARKPPLPFGSKEGTQRLALGKLSQNGEVLQFRKH